MILENLDAEVLSLLAEIEALGFSLCLVGGTVRDYLIDQSIGKDLDFEIRPATKKLSVEQWESEYSKILKLFEQKKLTITKYHYLITKISMNDYDLEFSSPRIENLIPGNLTHHHFDAVLDGSLDYNQSFKRRDLTINAIGMELSLKSMTENIVDPFFGVQDIKARKLRHINQDFFFDSVRFLRLARFQVKMKEFSIAAETMKELHLFNLQEMSVHYIKQEAIKSKNAGRFFNLVANMLNTVHLKINPKSQVVFQITYPEELTTLEQIVAYALFINRPLGNQMAALFSFPEKTVRDIHSFCDSLSRLSPVTQEELKKLVEKDFNQLKNDSVLKDFKNIFEKRIWMFIINYEAQKKIDWASLLNGELPVMSEQERIQVDSSDRNYWRYYHKLKQDL